MTAMPIFDLPDKRTETSWTTFQDKALKRAIALDRAPDEAARVMAVFRPGLSNPHALVDRAIKLGLNWEAAESFPRAQSTVERRAYCGAERNLLQRVAKPLEDMLQAQRMLKRVWESMIDELVIVNKDGRQTHELVDDLDLLIAKALRMGREARDIFHIAQEAHDYDDL